MQKSRQAWNCFKIALYPYKLDKESGCRKEWKHMLQALWKGRHKDANRRELS